MKTRLWSMIAVGFGLACLLVAGPATALDYPGDFALLPVPDPLAGDNPPYPLVKRTVPEPGESFYDSRFGTVLTRATEGLALRQEYSRFDPFNEDRSMIIMHDFESGNYIGYRTGTRPYNTAANQAMILGFEEPRWDPIDPNLVWGLSDLQIIQADVAADTTRVIKDFSSDPTIGPILQAEPDIYRITTGQEGETSTDKRYWALALQGSAEEYRLRYIFCWDRVLDRVLGLYTVPAAQAELVDWVGMSPLGTYVLIGGDYGPGSTLAGLNMADRELTSFHRLAQSTAHSDVGLDSLGREVVVMQNTSTDRIDLIPLDPAATPVIDEGGYTGNMIQPLVRLFYDSTSPYNFQSGVHISCNLDGYALISTYLEPGLTEQNWLDRSIILVRLNGENPRAYYLAKVHNTTGAYWEETQATVSADGSRVVWASNWNREVGQERIFLMELTMPPNWRRLVGGNGTKKTRLYEGEKERNNKRE